MSTTPSLEDLRDAFETLYDDLSAAYWSASTIEVKDRIYGTEELVADILDMFYLADLDKRTDVYKRVAADIQPSLVKLDELRKDIDSIIHAVTVAAKVADSIAKALGLAAKYFV